MRLIDAAKFDAYSFNVPKQYNGQEIAYIDGACSVLERMDEAQTICPDALPIVRELREELQRVTAERDRAIRAVTRLVKEDANPCVFCAKGGVKCSGMNPDFCDSFEWRGLVAENVTTESEVKADG